MGPGNHVLDGVQIPPWEGANFLGEWASYCKVQGHSTVVCAKTAEPIGMPFGLWARMGPRNHVLDGGPYPPWEGVIIRGKGAARCKV